MNAPSNKVQKKIKKCKTQKQQLNFLREYLSFLHYSVFLKPLPSWKRHLLGSSPSQQGPKKRGKDSAEYWEKTFNIDGQLFVGKNNDSDVDYPFFLQHDGFNLDKHRHWISEDEAKRIILALENLLYSKEVLE